MGNVARTRTFLKDIAHSSMTACSSQMTSPSPAQMSGRSDTIYTRFDHFDRNALPHTSCNQYAMTCPPCQPDKSCSSCSCGWTRTGTARCRMSSTSFHIYTGRSNTLWWCLRSQMTSPSLVQMSGRSGN